MIMNKKNWNELSKKRSL